MAEILVEKTSDGQFSITVKANRTTEHQVSLKNSNYQELTGGSVSEEVLIEKSFEFLLERESNTSILSSFDLLVIARYFPEYSSEIKKRF